MRRRRRGNWRNMAKVRMIGRLRTRRSLTILLMRLVIARLPTATNTSIHREKTHETYALVAYQKHSRAHVEDLQSMMSITLDFLCVFGGVMRTHARTCAYTRAQTCALTRTHAHTRRHTQKCADARAHAHVRTWVSTTAWYASGSMGESGSFSCMCFLFHS